MDEVVECKELAAQPPQRLWLHGAHCLERDRAAAMVVVCGVDHSHPPGAQALHDLEAALRKRCAGNQDVHVTGVGDGTKEAIDR